ncbi:hypothetical protein [Gordonia polyisoprenivorans]|uniref:Uncharacterized protein n=1 Tax=Gordonia polyisoprenivorans TaxID=84595 RepID=A0A846WLY4_9ACTN|nr:hypothetical protein [Gordonia polyisoprenivorans]NKY01813.1 hypothetical protein [Gordonia polyisoprenivorans]WCB36882.1 hypothetical protein PHA63_22960 [Gordonia polyisoprenivorans]
MLTALEARMMRQPGLLEIIDGRDAGVVTARQMMTQLLAIDYTEGFNPNVNNAASDAYVRGNWDDIEHAFVTRRITYREYETLFRALRSQSETARSDASRIV